MSAGSVFAALPLNVGETIDDQALVQATRSLFKTGFFQDIQLGRDGNVLVVTVVERPSISSIEIEGNKAISKEDLLKGLKQSGLAEGEIFQRATLEGVRNELQRQYVAQGRYSAEINAEVIPQPRNRVALKININEGTVAAISHINVVGNTVFSEEDLTDLFELKTTNWLSFFKNDDKYAREKLSGDLERLRSYYLDRGYINMDIASTQVSITPDKKHVYITVNINEGEKYTIRDVKLTGDLKVPEEEVKRLLLVQKGQVFSRKVMTTTSDLITRRLGNEGYTFANVNGVPEAHDDDKTVSVTFVVDPGKRAYVNRINFRGNTKTEDEVLRREMRQMEGGWASTYLIDQSKARLERLGYFKEVNVETPAVPGTDDQVDVNYSVEEQPSGSITASVGFAQSAGLILGGSISQNNFLGTGNKVSIGLTRSEYQTRYNFGFVDPYWTVDGVSLGYNAFYRRRRRQLLGEQPGRRHEHRLPDQRDLAPDLWAERAARPDRHRPLHRGRDLRLPRQGRRQLHQLQGFHRLVRIDPEQGRAGHPWSLAEPDPGNHPAGQRPVVLQDRLPRAGLCPADRQLHHALPHRAGLWRRLRIHRAPAVLRELLRRRLQLGARLQGQHAGAS